MIVGYGGESSGFPTGLSPAPLITTFPQASLRSRKVGFPESGSDLGATPSVVFPGRVSLAPTRIHPNSPQFTSRGVPLFTGPRCYSSGYSWNHQVPRAPSRAQGVTSHAVAASSTSAGVTPSSSLLQAHAPVLTPPTAYG